MIVILKAFYILITIILIAPIQLFLVIFKLRYRFYLPILFHKIILKILRIKVKLIGKNNRYRPLVLVGNHTSYIDIMVLGSLMPISFIAKSEISKWFLFGFLAKMQNTVFITRKNFKTKESLKKINKKLNNNYALVLFPEGTTNAGKKILNFKTSLFNLFENNNTLRLQNFTLCYTHVNDMPIDCRSRPQISWYGDMNLFQHLGGLLKLSCIDVTVVFHQTFLTKGLHRKEISNLSMKQVKEGNRIVLKT